MHVLAGRAKRMVNIIVRNKGKTMKRITFTLFMVLIAGPVFATTYQIVGDSKTHTDFYKAEKYMVKDLKCQGARISQYSIQCMKPLREKKPLNQKWPSKPYKVYKMIKCSTEAKCEVYRKYNAFVFFD